MLLVRQRLDQDVDEAVQSQRRRLDALKARDDGLDEVVVVGGHFGYLLSQYQGVATGQESDELGRLSHLRGLVGDVLSPFD